MFIKPALFHTLLCFTQDGKKVISCKHTGEKSKKP